MLLPLPIDPASPLFNTSNAGTIPGFIPHPVAATNDRTVFTIVWSCVATLFGCGWVAVHPDVSGLDDGRVHRFFHRVELLLWVLISPEAVLVWAWRQHRGAQALRYMFNDPNEPETYVEHWNLVHAHFLQMGGFVLCTNRDDDKSFSIASPDEFRECVKHRTTDLPKGIKTLEISDRSKGDGFTYLVAITQLGWFIAQSIGRAAAGLSITLFELTSISFVPITIIVYILWWQKPQNAQSTIVLLQTPAQSTPPEVLPHKDPENSQEMSQSGGIESKNVETLWPFPASLLAGAIKTFEDMLGTTSRSQSSIQEKHRQVPPFYAYPHEHDSDKIPLTPLIMGSLLGSTFGIVHLIGWNFRFATRLEKILWRCSASLIFVVPLLAVLVIFTARKFLHPKQSEKMLKYRKFLQRILEVLFGLLATLLTLSYLTARIILLVVMCTSLRALSPSQLRDITWVTDIPHIV